MYIELLQQLLAHLLIRPASKKHTFRNNDAGPAALGQIGHDVLQKQALGRPTANAEVGLHFLRHLAAVGRIGEDDLALILLGDVLAMHFEGIRKLQIRTLDAVQDHVHRSQQIGQRLQFQAKEGFVLQVVQLLAAQVAMPADEVGGLAEKTRGTEAGS